MAEQHAAIGHGMNAVQAAITQAGGVERCANMLGVSERAVYVWMQRGHMRGVAAEIVLKLAARSKIQAEILVGIGARRPKKVRQE